MPPYEDGKIRVRNQRNFDPKSLAMSFRQTVVRQRAERLAPPMVFRQPNDRTACRAKPRPGRQTES